MIPLKLVLWMVIGLTLWIAFLKGLTWLFPLT